MYEQQLISLSEAADLVDKSRTTLWRAIKSGKLSGEKGENDQWVVHLSELERVYKRVNVAQQLQKKWMEQSEGGDATREHPVATDVLQSKVEMLEQERTRLLEELSTLRADIKEERQENRQERERLLGMVEQSQKQLTHERDRYDEEIKRARARLKAFTQNQKRPTSANSNKVLREDTGSAVSSKPGLLGWLLGK